MTISWNDPTCEVTPFFTVNDCLMLHRWSRLATKADGADFGKLTTLCQKLEEVRAILGCPMNVHCMFRSTKYNLEQKIMVAKDGLDVHALSEACDFDCNENLTTDEVKAALMPHLESLGIRMENNGPNSSWIHLDLHEVIHSRFFSV